MKEFLNQNGLSGWLILGGIYILIIIGYYFFRVKPSRKEFDKHPEIDYLGKIFGKKGVVVVYVIAMFVVFPLMSYLMIGYFSVGQAQTNQVTTTNTGFLTQTMENLNNIASEWFDYLRANPKYSGLAIAGFGLIMLIALIKDADWILERDSGGFWTLDDKIEVFGRKTMRILMAIPCIVLIVFGLFMFFIWY